MNRVVVRLVVAILVIAIAAAASAIIPEIPTSEKQYEITDAGVAVQLQKDGSLVVHERLPFDFTGHFSGAFRDIPLAAGARITSMRVEEDGRDYQPGGNTGLGSADAPGRFGTQQMRHGLRVVWHYNAADETRVFDLVYRVTGAVRVHDDVVDVGWFVWGSQWDFWLDHLFASIDSASGVAPTEAWLEPRSLGADVELGDDARVSVDRLAAGKAVALHAVFPRDAIDSASGAVVVRGSGLDAIEADEAKLDDEYGSIDKLKNFVFDNGLVLALIFGGLAAAATALLMHPRPRAPHGRSRVSSRAPRGRSARRRLRGREGGRLRRPGGAGDPDGPR